MEDQNDLVRSAARAFKANVATGGKGDKAELAAQPLLCTGRRNTRKSFSSDNPESLPCVSSRSDRRDPRISLRDARRVKVLMLKEKRSAFRIIEGWAISILLDASAICECEEHGWMTDPQATQRAIEIARQ
jgi:hypothetical protein